ncbi:hypothetical protein ACIA59_10465 [Micromonospora haikouensis]|uniref:hypothetical protein n=1 Tax=Micromonospora haikouensis TaxID=686309 RepID=UPI0037978792
MTAPDLPPVQPLGPMPGTGSGTRPGGPTAFPAAAAQVLTVADPLCGHIDDEGHDEACTYWRMVACGELRGPDMDGLLAAIRTPLVTPAPLVDPALRQVA